MKIRLDEAIDRVAARMTAVEEDEALATRIADALPERSGWSLYGWAPRLAIAAALAIGTTLVVLRTFDEGSTDVLRTDGATTAPTIAEPPSNDRRTNVEPPLIVRRTSVEASSNVRGMTVEADRPDHEFSLAAIAAPEGLAMSPLSPGDLPAEDTLTIAPLEIADLPLTGESFAPR